MKIICFVILTFLLASAMARPYDKGTKYNFPWMKFTWKNLVLGTVIYKQEKLISTFDSTPKLQCYVVLSALYFATRGQ